MATTVRELMTRKPIAMAAGIPLDDAANS